MAADIELSSAEDMSDQRLVQGDETSQGEHGSPRSIVQVADVVAVLPEGEPPHALELDKSPQGFARKPPLFLGGSSLQCRHEVRRVHKLGGQTSGRKTQRPFEGDSAVCSVIRFFTKRILPPAGNLEKRGLLATCHRSARCQLAAIDVGQAASLPLVSQDLLSRQAGSLPYRALQSPRILAPAPRSRMCQALEAGESSGYDIRR
jgi:hypothetical protein